MNNRGREIRELARILYNEIEPQLQANAVRLRDDMEINHFCAHFANLVAIHLHLVVGALEQPQGGEAKP